jgi:hypothetical protein
MVTKKFLRGDVNEAGLIFFTYSNGKEKWVSKEEFLLLKQKELEDSRKPNIVEKRKLRGKEYYRKNKIREKERKAKFYKENKDKIIERTKEYDKKNREKVNKRKREYQKERWKNNEKFRCIGRIRSRIRCFIKNNKGKDKNFLTWDALGCTWEELKIRFESFFTEEINWDTMDKWHIDHIIPLSSAKNSEELKKLCHYTNLQPLMAKDNLSKKDKIL